VLVELPGREGPLATLAVIGGDQAPALLGVSALDALGLGVDTSGTRLIEKVLDLLLQTTRPRI